MSSEHVSQVEWFPRMASFGTKAAYSSIAAHDASFEIQTKNSIPKIKAQSHFSQSKRAINQTRLCTHSSDSCNFRRLLNVIPLTSHHYSIAVLETFSDSQSDLSILQLCNIESSEEFRWTHRQKARSGVLSRDVHSKKLFS